MRIYLAARYSRREHLRELAAELHRMGHVATSRRIEGTHELGPDGRSVEVETRVRAKFAVEDSEDVLDAECAAPFTEEPGAGGRGGRHAESGTGLATGKRPIVVGPRENVFHSMPQVETFSSQWDMLRALEAEATAAQGVERSSPLPGLPPHLIGEPTDRRIQQGDTDGR